MSFQDSFDVKFPDSVRTLGHLDAIEEEQLANTKEPNIPLSTLKNRDNGHTLDKEKTFYFNDSLLNDHDGQLKNIDQIDSAYQKDRIANIDDHAESSDYSESDYEMNSLSNSVNLSWKTVDNLKETLDLIKQDEIVNGIQKLQTSQKDQKAGIDKPKRSKWGLFFKRSKKEKKERVSDSERSSRKLLGRFLPRGKSFISGSNGKNESRQNSKSRAKQVAEESKRKEDSVVLKDDLFEFENNYQILNQIGSGGHSVVHLAVRKSDNQKFVAKYIQCVSVWHWYTDNKTKKDIPLEIEMLKRFNEMGCNGIIKYYEHFDLGTKFAIIMEYLGEDWVDLYDYIENFGPVCEKEATEIFTRVVKVVSFLHNCGYSHNDIKDENVMINIKTRQIKLIDFGSITKLNCGIMHNTFYGTRKFQSPEAIQGSYLLEFQEVWALGTLYYVLLFKMDPFKNDDEVLQVDILKRMERIRHFGVDGQSIFISDKAVSAIHKMLDRDWKKRPKVSEILSLQAFSLK